MVQRCSGNAGSKAFDQRQNAVWSPDDQKELRSSSGNSLDYFTVKGATILDFRADNDTNFTSLEKNSIDLYSSLKSIYLQDRENKIRNSIEDQDEWGNLDN